MMLMGQNRNIYDSKNLSQYHKTTNVWYRLSI